MNGALSDTELNGRRQFSIENKQNSDLYVVAHDKTSKCRCNKRELSSLIDLRDTLTNIQHGFSNTELEQT